MNAGWTAFLCLAALFLGIVIGATRTGDMYSGRIKGGLVQLSDGAVYRTARIEGEAP